MACFIVAAAVGVATVVFRHKVPEKYHIEWLNLMIWGSVLALLVEHIWHGEIVPWFPFLTAMSSSGDTVAMLHEMAYIGIPMVLTVTAIWGAMVYFVNKWPQSTTATADIAA
ncbi:MAG: hypothetical protein FWC29_03395 [Methanomassiliicoccaceae archaeon]|nr:hypothetical protein [Methanomassiliicoccaceae archaeon]